MHKKKDNGVSPVIATILLISLSVVLVAIVSVSVMSGLSSFSAVDTKIVGFTVVVNDNETATVTPVSGKDLPDLQSYIVYLDNGHIQSVPESGSDVLSGAIITDFDDNVTRINIAGNFTDGITALVFSGKVINKTVVYDPSHGGEYYVVGSEPYDNTSAFVDSLNEWQPGTIVYEDAYHNTGRPILKKDIVVAYEPIVITADMVDSSGFFQIVGSQTGDIPVIRRAPGYDGALLVIEEKGFNISYGTITFDGMGHGNEPIIIVGEDTSFYAANYFTVKNGTNEDGVGPKGGGMYIAGTVDFHDPTSIIGNSAKYGGGIFIDTGGSLTMRGGSITGNFATENGGGIYNRGTYLATSGTISNNQAQNGGGIYNDISGKLGDVAQSSPFGLPISHNKATVNGGGVYNAGYVYFGWPAISDNTASNAGQQYYATSRSTNTAYGDYFTQKLMQGSGYYYID